MEHLRRTKMRAITSYISRVGFIHNYEVFIDNYKDYYKHLECEMFDVVRVNWNGHDISIFVDDEALLKPRNYGRRVEGYPEALFGNMVICGGVDDEGETLDLPEEFTLINVSDFISEVIYVTKG
jgi:hypothetical protein